jgi:DNA-binding transcriptional MerR regulator
VTAGDQWSVGDLARLGGVSRRTVRYYVQEGLIPPPRGLGRAATYGHDHLERLLRVKELQERGLTLEEVRREVEPGRRAKDLKEKERTSAAQARLARSLWTRIEILPGVELHLSSGSLAPSKLDELSDWCRLHIRQNRENDDA